MKKHKSSGKKLSVILVTGFIVFSMVISIFAIVLDNPSQDVPSYNKYSFAYTNNNGYKTKINDKYMEFYYYPADLERINLSNEIMTKIKSSGSIAFVFDPNDNRTDNLMFIDAIRYDLESQSQLDKLVYFGITSNSTKYLLTVADCSQATDSQPMILINTSSSDVGFFQTENPNCIIMNAKLRDILAAKDRLVYTYYGVMK